MANNLIYKWTTHVAGHFPKGAQTPINTWKVSPTPCWMAVTTKRRAGVGRCGHGEAGTLYFDGGNVNCAFTLKNSLEVD